MIAVTKRMNVCCDWTGFRLNFVVASTFALQILPTNITCTTSTSLSRISHGHTQDLSKLGDRVGKGLPVAQHTFGAVSGLPICHEQLLTLISPEPLLLETKLSSTSWLMQLVLRLRLPSSLYLLEMVVPARFVLSISLSLRRVPYITRCLEKLQIFLRPPLGAGIHSAMIRELCS